MINLLDLGTLTSKYGDRNSPTAGASKDHKGIDIVLKNYNIPAVTGGEVIANGYSTSSGYYVTIKDANGYEHTYMHMARQSKLGIGSYVTEGATIGMQGSTGISTGDHLHFEVTDSQGNYINPENFLSGATGTIPPGTSRAENLKNSLGLTWWGDIVKVVLAALLILTGAVMLVLGVKGEVGDMIGGKIL